MIRHSFAIALAVALASTEEQALALGARDRALDTLHEDVKEGDVLEVGENRVEISFG